MEETVWQSEDGVPNSPLTSLMSGMGCPSSSRDLQ
jgi:hypothetical protein